MRPDFITQTVKQRTVCQQKVTIHYEVSHNLISATQTLLYVYFKGWANTYLRATASTFRVIVEQNGRCALQLLHETGPRVSF